MAHFLNYYWFLGHVISTYVINQSRCHWLLNDALNFATSKSLKFANEMKIITSLNNLMDEYANLVFEITCLVSTLEQKLLGFGLFYFHSKEMWKKNQNMLFLMLNLKWKMLNLLPSLINQLAREGHCWRLWYKVFISHACKMPSTFAPLN
jgi:hypothetical protein